jgi:hypothetical protein
MVKILLLVVTIASFPVSAATIVVTTTAFTEGFGVLTTNPLDPVPLDDYDTDQKISDTTSGPNSVTTSATAYQNGSISPFILDGDVEVSASSWGSVSASAGSIRLSTSVQRVGDAPLLGTGFPRGISDAIGTIDEQGVTVTGDGRVRMLMLFDADWDSANFSANARMTLDNLTTNEEFDRRARYGNSDGNVGGDISYLEIITNVTNGDILDLRWKVDIVQVDGTPSAYPKYVDASNTAAIFVEGLDGASLGFNDANFLSEEIYSTYGVVPLPAAAWLFGSGLLVLVGIARRKKA